MFLDPETLQRLVAWFLDVNLVDGEPARELVPRGALLMGMLLASWVATRAIRGGVKGLAWAVRTLGSLAHAMIASAWYVVAGWPDPLMVAILRAVRGPVLVAYVKDKHGMNVEASLMAGSLRVDCRLPLASRLDVIGVQAGKESFLDDLNNEEVNRIAWAVREAIFRREREMQAIRRENALAMLGESRLPSLWACRGEPATVDEDCCDREKRRERPA